MSVTIRGITEADVEHLFALDEINKVSQFRAVYLGCPKDFLNQCVRVAIDEATGIFITETCQGDQMDPVRLWLLVWDGKIILTKKSHVEIDYISPELIGRLPEITSFVREALAIGWLGGAEKYWTKRLAVELEFALETAGDRGCVINDLNLRIRRAAMAGDANEVAQVLSEGADVNEKSIYRWRPLTWAATKGHADICTLLIEQGADVNVKDNHGSSALSYAACRGNADVCRLLVGRGADVNVKDSRGRSPLMEAARWGYADICRLLVEHGADVNEKDNEGSSPLLDAVCSGHAHVCRLLVERGAKVDEKNNNGGFPLLFASGEGLADICRLLVERGADVNEKAGSGVIALTSAISNGHTDICKYLLMQGTDVSLATWRNQTAFEIASDKDHHGCIAALIAWQSFSTTTGYTPGGPALPWIRQKLDTLMPGGSAKAELSLSVMDEAGDWEKVMVMGAMYAESLAESSGAQN